MSHFTRIATQITDAAALCEALRDVGFPDVEVHSSPQSLYGYRGDRRPQTAEVIVRRKYIGPASNDIGFQQQSDGTFTAIISAFDRRKYDQRWLGRLTQRYAYHVAQRMCRLQGFALVSEALGQAGELRLVLRRLR